MNSDFCVAVHALVYLNRRGCVLSSEELARNICTNPARVRKVLARMKKDGLVETKEGSSGGGYRFAKGAGEVSLAQVARAVGYESQSKFSAEFKKVFGMLPSEFRKLHAGH